MAIGHRDFFKWHIWLGWLIGVPIILWTASGLFMVARPIEEVRGTHLRAESESTAIAYKNIALFADNGGAVSGARLIQQDSLSIWIVTYENGEVVRYSAATGRSVPEMTRDMARIAAEAVYLPEEAVLSTRLFPADKSPSDLRRETAAWQVHFADGTNVYINAATGETLAVRTRFWRAFDFMWGLHIMDLQTREDTSHSVLIGSAALALLGSILGFVMLFTRRRRKQSAATGMLP
ncbi:PepSY domain-containing protein [Parasphingorhabdus sp.]|uniref:PepSY domain-containing protein n=1 Tax=Parasphingorhabdus sp. TaxID=2709688 RepID=UPI0032633220